MKEQYIFLRKKKLYLNVKRKSLVPNDGLILLIKADTTGIGSEHWCTYKAFLSNFAKNAEKFFFLRKETNLFERKS